MIVEIGHFALILALALALVQTIAPLVGAWRGDRALMGVASSAAIGQFALIVVLVRRAGVGASGVRFLGAQRRREFAQRRAGDLQVLRHLGQSRRLDAAVGLSSWRRSARWWPCSAARCRRPLRANALAVQGLIGVAFLALHPA